MININQPIDSKTPENCILVINCGSSSIKFSLIQTTTESALLTGLVDRLTTPETQLEWKFENEEFSKALPGADLVTALGEVISILPNSAKVVAIGHRVVHGGEAFAASVIIDSTVMSALEKCSALAPLHNPANIAGIRAASEVFPNLPQVAVFDTAFHQTIPEHAYLYAVPYDWYEEHGVRRYGFHGTSHRFVALETARQLGKPVGQTSCIIAHLGNGCSACAVENGKSVDTTMGLSPLEGLVMGTRSGNIDPALPEFIAKNLGWSLEKIMTKLNKQSGLLGLSGHSNDMRTLVEASEKGDARAQLAIEVFAYRLAKSIMALTASLSKLDAITFTGGIGENSHTVRAKAIEHLKVLKIEIDAEANQCHGSETNGQISTSASLPCLVVPTNEELMIARETLNVTKL